MAKKLVLEFETGLSPKYKKWAREAVEKFVSLFPEYKNSLTIDIDATPTSISRTELENIISRSSQVSPQTIRDLYEEQPDGTFLRKDSLDYRIKNARVSNAVDLGKILDKKTQKNAVPGKESVFYAGNPLLISVCNQEGCAQNNGRYVFGARGISNAIGGPCIAAKTCEKVCLGYSEQKLEAYFKDIIIHELGHSFHATHEERNNCVENLGPHCTDAACLMYEYAYTAESFNRRQTEGRDNPFCNDCMESMREYMQNTLKLERNNDNNQTQANTINEQDLLSGLSNEEKTFLKDYLDYIRSSGIHRSPEDLLWDRVYLLERFRREHRNSNVNTETLKQEFKTVAETFDWNKEKYKNKLTPKARRKLETFLSQRKEQSIEVNDQALAPTVEKEASSLYKMQLRGILRNSAQKEHLEYNEEPQKYGFKAELKSADGSKTTIEATAQKVSLMSHNAKGDKVTPPFRRFIDIVSYAQQRHSSVSFGEIKTPEFKANLMIACLKAQPPVRMKGAPKVNEEFLNSLDSTTAKLLHEAYYSRKIEKELPTYEGLKRSQAERYLELKSKQQNPKPREWAELFYLEDQLVGDIALKEAEQRFGSPRPREAEWHQKTGFEPQRIVHYKDKRPGDASWKIHLDVPPNPNEPTTKAITEYLQKLDMDYKICGGEENGKGITVYVGSYQDVTDLSTRLQMEFGDKVKLPARYTDQFNQETEFQYVATGRFMIAANYDPQTKKETPVFDEVYPTTVRGISPARLDEHNSTGFLIKAAKQMKLVPNQTPDDYNQITDAKQHYDIDTLENYVSHRLYAKYLGAFYYGENAERFEQHLFNDKLPEAGSPERKKWDILANKYEQFIKDNCPEKIDLMVKHIEGYQPIDFTKENTHQNVSQQNNSTLTQQIIKARQHTNR